jgi:hypothetical protein
VNGSTRLGAFFCLKTEAQPALKKIDDGQSKKKKDDDDYVFERFVYHLVRINYKHFKLK